MDLVYIVGGLSYCDRADLRYSLRSISKFAKGIDRVFVVGDCPEWLSDSVISLPYQQPYEIASGFQEKHTNMMCSLMHIVETVPDLSDEFLISSDDHFLSKPVDFSNYPFYAKLTSGGLDIPNKNKTGYQKALLSTKEYLKSKDLPFRFMALHRNMKMIRNAVLDCFPMFNEILEGVLSVEPYILVGNWMVKHYGIRVQPVKDYKITKGSDWWKSSGKITDTYSVGDLKYNSGLQILLSGKYDKKCIYEKD